MLEGRARSGFHTTIHRELICYFSKYYNALLKGRFSESGQKKITLKMSKYKARLLVTWLYTGHIADDVDYQNLFQLYVSADQTDILALRRATMNQIHRNSHEKKNPGLANVAEDLKVLPKSSGLVRWMVDRFAHHWTLAARAVDVVAIVVVVIMLSKVKLVVTTSTKVMKVGKVRVRRT
ncbi:hypothetical protein E4T47_05852 [Aureobasidium subglaciale]|nr:hypothetical protein E4T47_05852 [Aureobasidium subglaciale]